MGWIWLDAPRLDFGRPDAEEWEGERTVWIYADPHTVLGVPASADEGELQRAYRRLARVHHPDLNPDDDDALERFHELQRAYAVATGKGEVAVEPTSGAWWRLTGISGSPSRGSLAVAGLSFELRDAHRVPFRDAEDTVRVTYAGRSFPLTVAHSRGATAAALWQARAAVAAEWSLLVLICLVLVPVVALIAAADLYVLSNTSEALAWASVAGIVGLGYGALALILASSGHPVPTPRRAVRRTRAAVAELRALHAGRTKPGQRLSSRP